MGIIAVCGCLDHLLATGNCPLQNIWVGDRRKYFIARSLEQVRAAQLHRDEAISSARRAFTQARCARNSEEAWISLSGSTPAVAFSEASAILLGVNGRPRKSASTA